MPMSSEEVPIEERNAEIGRLYLEGLSLQDLGDKFNISHERIRQVLQNSEIPLRRQGQQPTLKVKKGFGKLTPKEAFQKKLRTVVDPVAGDHFVWKGTIAGKYGRFRLYGILRYAHHVAFYLATGRFPKRLQKKCGIDGCVRYEHWEEK